LSTPRACRRMRRLRRSGGGRRSRGRWRRRHRRSRGRPEGTANRFAGPRRRRRSGQDGGWASGDGTLASMARPPAALRVAKPSPTVPRDALPAEARAAVLAWFAEVGRALAFRGTRDPYAILVSEVMAQQTQVARVVVAWGRFMNRFPTVAALAAATPADVLRAWQGMGYDRRALNLRRAARAIVEAHGGRVPNDVAALEHLPGIGPYTARAVASIAFGARVGAVDTNVRRVLGRVLAGQDAGALTPTELQSMADASV